MSDRAGRYGMLLLLSGSIVNGLGCRRTETNHAVLVEIRTLAFTPATLRVRVGDTLHFVNRDLVPHTATQDHDVGDAAAPSPFAMVSPMLVKDGEYLWIARTPGTVAYHCLYHPSMTASVLVTP